MNNYASLDDNHEQEGPGEVLYHQAELSRARWNHIENLDSFFSRMYQYHQKHGFFCMVLQEVLELLQFVFIVFLTIYVCHGIDYQILFKNKLPPSNSTKVTLHDVILTPGECVQDFAFLSWLALLIVTIVWILKLIKGIYHMFHFWEIKQFYNTALKIDDNELDNLTWHEVQTRVRTVQTEQQMCIHKQELTELDIYHRILRQQNYLVAMVNKKLLPPRFRIPFVGEVVYWTTGLRYTIQWLLFWSPRSPFENPWHLKEEYKKPNMRQELANLLRKQILWLILVHLIVAPLLCVWLVLYAFFSYAGIIRKEPSVLTKRRWSLYGRLYLRHFNELDHELQARLTRAYRPATKYVAAFSSPMGSIISESIGFFATAVLAILVVLSIYDEDVLTVEHVLSIMTILTLFVATLRSLAPDETTPWDPEKLLDDVVANTHYLPEGWSGQAHTVRIRKEFEQLFQYGFVGLFEGILSPFIIPYVLWTNIYPRSLDIVDFFRNFTVNVVGVGDVCSFAQMDVRRHGNPDWQENEVATVPNQYAQGEEGKVELSLMHFTCTNPSWRPPSTQAEQFVKNVHDQSSLYTSQSIGEYLLHKNLDDSLTTTKTDNIPILPIGQLTSVERDCYGRQLESQDLGGDHRWRAGPSSLDMSRFEAPSHASGMWRTEGPSLISARDMAINATYLHSVHNNKTGHKPPKPAQETTPLLSNR